MASQAIDDIDLRILHALLDNALLTHKEIERESISQGRRLVREFASCKT